MDHLTWRHNPQIFFCPSNRGIVEITLQTTEDFTGIGFYVFECPTSSPMRILYDNNSLVGKAKFVTGMSQVSTSFTIPKMNVPYVIVPTTYYPKFEMKFTVMFSCIDRFNSVSAQLISAIQEWPAPITGKWTSTTAGGCGNEDSVINNPQYLMKVKTSTKVGMLLLQLKEDFDSIGFYVLSVQNSGKISNPSIFQEESKFIVNPDFGDPNEFFVEKILDPGSYVIIPCTFDANQIGDFQLWLMCQPELELILL